jgi:hypothetical protein
MKTKLNLLSLLGASLVTANGEEARSLQDMAAATAFLPSATIYTAKEIVPSIQANRKPEPSPWSEAAF